MPSGKKAGISIRPFSFDAPKYCMESFKQFVEDQEFIESVIAEFNAPSLPHPKPWSAKKKDVMNTWKMLRPETPIYMTPMSRPDAGDMKTYGEDGIRITGSYAFITSVMAKLKELLTFENPQNKLRLVFRAIDNHTATSGKKSFVFYVNLDGREGGKPHAPAPPKPHAPAPPKPPAPPKGIV